MTGDAFLASIKNLTGGAREAAVMAALNEGQVPSYLSARVPVTVSAVIGGVEHVLTYFVAPDYLEIGETAADARRIPATPWTYQAYADAHGLVLPTRRMVNAIWKVAPVHVEPATFSPTERDALGHVVNETTARYLQSDNAIRAALAASPGYAPGILVGGAKKDVVNGPNLNGSLVAIYGWHKRVGSGGDTSTGRWQPYSTIHPSDYADYSHGARMVSRRAFLDGNPVDLSSDIAEHPILHVLVSDQGPFALHFPNAGSGGPVVFKPPPAPPPKPKPPTTQQTARGGGDGIVVAIGAAAIGAFALSRIL